MHTTAKRWMMAGAAAALLGGGTARAGSAANPFTFDDTTYPDLPEPRQVEVTIDGRAIVPQGRISARPGEEVQATFTNKSDAAGGTELVLPDYGVRAALPPGQSVEVLLRADSSGAIPYSVQPPPVASGSR